MTSFAMFFSFFSVISLFRSFFLFMEVIFCLLYRNIFKKYEVSLCFFPRHSSLFAIPLTVRLHQNKGSGQHCAADPYRPDPENGTEIPADPGSDPEDRDNRDIAQSLLQILPFSGAQEEGQCRRSASKVSDAHCACISISSHFPEGLNLHRAGK